MACSGEAHNSYRGQKHVSVAQCLDFLHNCEQNTHIPQSKEIIKRFERSFEEGLQPLLLLMTQGLKRMEDCMVFLRRFDILDRTDCEVLISDKKYEAPEMKLMYLVDLLERREIHSYWYFAHSLNSGTQPASHALFDYLHGDIHCCFCSEVKEEEKKIKSIVERKNTHQRGTIAVLDNSPISLAVDLVTSLPVVTDIVGKFPPARVGQEALQCVREVCLNLGEKSSEVVQDRLINNIWTLFS